MTAQFPPQAPSMWRRNPRGLTEEETASINLNVPNDFLKMQVHQISAGNQREHFKYTLFMGASA